MFPRIIIATFAPDKARPTDRRAKTLHPIEQDPPPDEGRGYEGRGKKEEGRRKRDEEE